MKTPYNFQARDLIDKVIFYKGRVWTIYAADGSNTGVFAYQGLKPYSTFRYSDSHSDRAIAYISLLEASVKLIDGDQIQECIKQEKAAESKKLSKKMAVEFLSELTGHGKSKINAEIKDDHNSFSVQLGRINYSLYKLDGRLRLNHNLHGTTRSTTFDFVTWKHDIQFEDREKRRYAREEREEIIEDYKHTYHCNCDQKGKRL
jgi:hypothetical protein